MTLSSRGKILALLAILALLGALPLILYLQSQQQDQRSKAEASTSLSFTPATTLASPFLAPLGGSVTLDLMLNPGNNAVSFVKLDILYDPTKLSPSGPNPLQIDTANFPIILEGPVLASGSMKASISVGNDPTKAITTTARVATLTFQAAAYTSSPTSIGFGPGVQILSVAASDQAGENVYQGGQTAFVAIPQPTPTPTPLPSPTVTPTHTPTPTSTPLPPTATPTVTPTRTPTPTPTPPLTQFSLNVFLHGVGKSGDSANPNSFTLSNQNPQNTIRPVTVEVLESNPSNGQTTLVTSSDGSVTYQPSTGNFTGIIDMGRLLQNKTYLVKIKSTKYLRKIAGIPLVIPGATNAIPVTTLVAGDANNDNSLDILDYNMLYGCYSVDAPPRNCDTLLKFDSDLNDDGNVNQFDYNLFLRELGNRNGE